ncbi:MAG: hypothetical protein DMG13_28975 [Acidobacteria bacterium]|nr:MAG: hypothetical protein DMG13_28975 [Acidobacteriota bacterium]
MTEISTGFAAPRSARYFQKLGRSGMQSNTAMKQVRPPVTTDMVFEEIVATQPALAFPSKGSSNTCVL